MKGLGLKIASHEKPPVEAREARKARKVNMKVF
jgi:hypothetical protein